MASYYRRERSPYYWIRRKAADGKVVRFSSGIRIDSDGSLRKIQQRIAEEAQKEQRFTHDSTLAIFRGWVPGWLAYHYQVASTQQRAINAWAWLSTFFALKKIHHPEEVTYTACHSYMIWRTDEKLCEKENRRCANWNTAVLELRFLGSIMQEALARNLCLANPCASLKISRRAAKQKFEITTDEQTEIEKKLKQADQWMQDSWLVGIKHGCRIAATKCPMQNIDIEMNAISFNEKGGKIHTVPIHKDILPLIHRRKVAEEKHLIDLPDNASRLWIDWFKKNGFSHLSFHCLRVTVITRLARANVSEAKAMQYVGHCNSLVHAIYRKLKAADVAELGDFL
ncbi:MAG: site-specific integrase [Luteolibacter sp.]